MVDLFWTFEMDDEIYDADFNTAAECLKAMDEFYAEKIEAEEGELKNGDKRSCGALMLKYQYNDNGERVILLRAEITAEYEHYHGDVKEHGTY